MLDDLRKSPSEAGVTIAEFSGFCQGNPTVVLPHPFKGSPVVAVSTVVLDQNDVGSAVAVTFQNGETTRPIIIGRILNPKLPDSEPAGLTVDGDSAPLEITAERELTLRCGKASITLTKEGKIILRGTYISSRSSGPNRIKGGSVHLN